MNISYITLIIYPILLLIFFFGSSFMKKGEFNEEWNSISQSKAIQGLMALCIVCHHVAQETCVSWLESGNIVHGLDVFSNTGLLFVSVFFFWSGYGLYKSVRTKENYLVGFPKKRILPIVYPYILVCFLYTLERLFALKEEMPLWFKITNFTGITIGYELGWYVQAIIVFYFLFYFAFKCSKNDSWAVTIVWVGIVLWTVLGLLIDHNDYSFKGEWWYNSVLSFPIGITFAKHEEKLVKSIKKGYKVLMPLITVLFFAFYYFSRFVDSVRGYYGDWMQFGFAKKMTWRVETYSTQIITTVLFVFVLLLVCMKIKLKNKILDFLGTHTLEIYLTHGFFLEFLSLYYNYHKNSIFYARPWVLLLATLILTIPSAIGLKKLEGLFK